MFLFPFIFVCLCVNVYLCVVILLAESSIGRGNLVLTNFQSIPAFPILTSGGAAGIKGQFFIQYTMQ